MANSFHAFAWLYQLGVEHFISNEEVGGSIPPDSTIFKIPYKALGCGETLTAAKYFLNLGP